MKDKDKPQNQSTEELTQLRRRIAQLQRSDTERKRAEKDLRDSETRYRRLFESAQDGILILEADTGKIIDVNPFLIEMLGYTHKEYHGKQLWEISLFKDIAENKIAFKRLQREKYIRYEHLPLKAKDGTQRDVEFVSNVYLVNGDEVIQCNIRDITDRKQAEDTLKEKEYFLNNIIEQTPNPMWISDRQGTIIRINQALRDLLKITDEEIIGKYNVLEDVQVKEQGLLPSIKTVFKEGKTVNFTIDYYTEKEKKLRLAQKTHKVLDIIIAPIKDEEGKLVNAICQHKDITERKQAEEAQRQSETRFQTLFEAIPDIVLVHDDEGTILHINEIGAQQLEWSAKELIGRNLREIVTAENSALIADHVEETHKVGWSRFETTYISRGGWQMAAEVNCRLIKFEKKKALLRVARDITARKEAERALLEEKNFSDAIINTSPDLLFVIGDQGNTIKWNVGAEAVTGYSASEIAKMNIFDFVAKGDKKNTAETIQEAFTKGLASVEINVVSISGKKIPFYIKGRSIKIGNTSCLVCTGMDITERKQAESRLRESEEKYRDLVENINDILYMTDKDGVVTYIAPAIELFSGYASSEIIGHPFFEFVYQEDAPHVLDKFRQIVAGQAIAHEYRMVTKSGVVRWVRTSSRPFFEGTRFMGVRGILVDITEPKRVAEELKRSYEQLHENLISTVHALASTVEMRDPYTAGHQRRATILACAIAEELDLAEERIEGIRMASLIHDIGKIMVPAEILSKPGSLTKLQYEIVKMHPSIAYDTLKEIKFPSPVAEIVSQHHERMDGSGYPHGVKGEEIMLEARILAVADVVEAMSSHRPYRPSLGIDKALEEISQNRGVLYDPDVVDACVRLFAEKGFELE
jgi:PAS domain S-box-containing protein